MRHRRKGSRLNRKPNQLKALLRNLVTSLILNDTMVTTQAKAKTLIPIFDRLVKKARNSEKREAIRDIKKIIFGEAAQRKFMDVIIPGLEGRTSGFTSRTKIGFRDGDKAPIVKISILLPEIEKKLKASKEITNKSEEIKNEEPDNSEK